jgi:hypothetical protein
MNIWAFYFDQLITLGVENRLACKKTSIYVIKSSTHSATFLPPDVGRRSGLYATFKRHGISVAAAKILQLPLDDRQRLHLAATKHWDFHHDYCLLIFTGGLCTARSRGGVRSMGSGEEEAVRAKYRSASSVNYHKIY